MKKIISIFLMLTMIGSLAACGNETPVSKETTSVKESVDVTPSETPSEEVKKDPVSITLFPANGNLTSGTVGGWLGEVFAENGIILDVWAYSADKFNAILASGDFPDVMYFNATKCDINAIIESGYLLDLTDYMDQLPNVQKNELMPAAMNFADQFIATTDKEGLYLLPTKVGALQSKLNTGGCALMLNWKLYEQIGCPEITCLEDTIDVFKQMQAAWPVSETGIKSYAMHLYSSADTGSFAGASNVLGISGYGVKQLPYFLASNVVTEEFEYILEDDGIYKYALQYYNTLYKEGLLDPDSITNDRATVMKIVEEGSNLAGWPCVPAYEKQDFFPAYYEGMYMPNSTGYSQYGSNNYIGISSKCKNIDTALALLDMFADPDKCFVIKTGPEGELWEFDANGAPVLTEKGTAYFINGEQVDIKGETFTNFNTALIVNTGVHTSYGKEYSAGGWPESLAAANSSDAANSWKAFYGADDLKTLLGKDYGTPDFDENLDKFVEAPSDEQELLFKAAQDIIIQASWKMVYAETEAEFEKIWDDAVAECEKLGIKELVEWRRGVLAEAMEARDALAN